MVYIIRLSAERPVNTPPPHEPEVPGPSGTRKRGTKSQAAATVVDNGPKTEAAHHTKKAIQKRRRTDSDVLQQEKCRVEMSQGEMEQPSKKSRYREIVDTAFKSNVSEPRYKARQNRRCGNEIPGKKNKCVSSAVSKDNTRKFDAPEVLKVPVSTQQEKENQFLKVPAPESVSGSLKIPDPSSVKPLQLCGNNSSLCNPTIPPSAPTPDYCAENADYEERPTLSLDELHNYREILSSYGGNVDVLESVLLSCLNEPTGRSHQQKR